MGNPDAGGRRDIDSLADTLRKREPLLRLLADDPRDRRDLRDELAVSRSTIYKSLQKLRDADLIAERDGRYELTGFGRLAWQRHDDYIARLNRLSAGQRLIETLPDDRQFPLSIFERGRIIVPGRHAPERPLDQLSAIGEHADRLRVLSPSGMPRFLAALHSNVKDGEQTASIVAEPDAIERLRAGYDDFAVAARADGIDIRRIEEKLPYAVVLFDSAKLGLFGYEEGLLVGAAFSADPDAIAWGEQTVDRAIERSEKI
jgi:predicted transcriptional regulator